MAAKGDQPELGQSAAAQQPGSGALRRLDRPDEAIAQFRRVIGINPRSPVAYNNLGLVLAEKAVPNGTQDDAIAQLNHAIELDRHYALPHYNLGRSFVHQGKLDDAIMEFRHAIALGSEIRGQLYRASRGLISSTQDR